MLSRSLGPEFGVAVGVAYYCAASISIAFYLIAFAENMVSCIGGSSAGSEFVSSFPGETRGFSRIASLALLLLVQAQCGADSVAKATHSSSCFLSPALPWP